MELELGLGLPSNGNNYYTTAMENQRKKKNNKYPKDDDHHHHSQRLVFVDGEEVESKRTTLSLLTWSGQPGDSHGGEKWSSNDDIHQVNDDEEIEGWPPVNSMRKEMIHHHQSNNNYYNGNNYNNNNNNGDENNNNSMRSSMYVKVKMEGVPIGRKIDLSQYDSYQSLSTALINMFAKYTDADAEYRILYQDREGDWMLAGDVPWRSFVESVQRVEILKNETE